MKRNHYLSVILIIILGITSCKDNYYIENDLHGMWQVMSIQNLSTDETFEPQGTLYYMFQRTMVSLCYYNLNVPEKYTDFIAHFDLIGSDSIGMGDFRYSTSGEGDKVSMETKVPISSLNGFGIYKDYTIFHLQQHLKGKIVLTSDSACVVLRRY